jgi:endoglucanase
MQEAEWDEMIAGWGANLIRIPFNQAWVLADAACEDQLYLRSLDTVIEWGAARGAYTVLDLQWLDAATPRGRNADGSINMVPALPDSQTAETWRILAARYRYHNAVIFDIFNEPHDPLPDDANPLFAIGEDRVVSELSARKVTPELWHGWARHLINAIRQVAPEKLLLVSGLNWAFDLSHFPLPSEQAFERNLVYSTHVYRSKGRRWYRAFGRLARTHPVFVAEIGGGNTDLRWGSELLNFLQKREIGWAAWSWSDKPFLIEPGDRENRTPTAFGRLVRDRLRALRSANM